MGKYVDNLASIQGILNLKEITSAAKNLQITDYTQQIDPLSQNTLSFTLTRLICQDLLPINFVVKYSAIKHMLAKTFNILKISAYLVWKHVKAVY